VVEVLLVVEPVQKSTAFALTDLELPEGTYVNRNKPNGQSDRFVFEAGRLVPVEMPKQP